MKGGIFEKMTPAKQVDFIMNVNKSNLGLKGMEIVVLCDRKRGKEENVKLYFVQIGENCLSQVTGKQIIEKYNLKEGKQIQERLRQERIEWIKKNQNKFRQKT